jgi:hypothetical protein
MPDVMTTSRQFTVRYLGICLALAIWSAGALPAAEPLTTGDMVALLEAGIGSDLVRMQAERTGTRLDPEVEDLLALRRAGASEELLAFLMHTADVQAAAPSTHEASSEVRVYVDDSHDGGSAIVLTNLDEGGQRLDGATAAPSRGVISSSERMQDVPAAASPQQGTIPAAAALPSAFEITVHRPVEDERLVQLEDRLRDLETTEPERPPVGADLPRHPINDFREYPILPFGYGLGYGYVLPGVRAQKATVTRYGSLPSFTSAYAAGIDPFRPVQPCTYGQACSVTQRLAYPNP